jgi:Kdo2-lipid IVA lauroyltransferase/acyltransferase
LKIKNILMANLIKFISRFSLTFFYGFSSYVLFPLMYYVLKYRRYVVFPNLQKAFPESGQLELRKKEKAFYKYLADLFVETIMSFEIQEKEILKHVEYQNVEVLDILYAQGKSVILTLGHIGNYEWMAQAFQLVLPHQCAVAYRKLKNPTFEKLFKDARGKYGMDMFPTEDTGLFLRKEHSRPYLLTLANDQSAPPDNCFWVNFLNQDTSFYVGTEKIAKKMNLPVVFAHVSVPERGKYIMRFELLTENPSQEPEGYIMQTHAKWLEKDILKQPENWLWSHKRWKHKMPEGTTYGFTSKPNS